MQKPRVRSCVPVGAVLTSLLLAACSSDGGSSGADTTVDDTADADVAGDTSTSDALDVGDDADTRPGGCVGLVTECLPPLSGASPDEACAIFSEQAGPCVAALVAAYEAEGCNTSCDTFHVPGLASLCGDPQCEPVRAVLGGAGFLTDQCETCFCAPSCGCRTCGDDGCGGSCGTCDEGETCSVDGQCLEGDAVSCAASGSDCGAASFDGCLCDGCVDDGVCDAGEEDCVCADCRGVGACSDASCVDDGTCDPSVEGCGCADCAAHPVCNRVGYVVTGDDQASTATAGTCGGTSATLGCPDGQLAVGVSGAAGAWLDRVALECQAVGAGGYLTGATTAADPLGTSTGGAGQPPAICPDGKVMVGAVVKHGDALDSVTPLCESVGAAAGTHCPAPAERLGGTGGSNTTELLCPDGYAVTGLVGPQQDYPCAVALRCSRVTPWDPAACRADGDSCDPTGTQDAPWTCLAQEGGSGVCARACDSAAACPVGRWCGDDDLCMASECDGFFSTEGCGEGQRCIPAGPGAYACVPTGAGEAQSACIDHADCGAGLLCLDGFCGAPECDAAAGTGCDPEDSCVPIDFLGYPTDLGRCARLCTAFVEGGCPADTWCVPRERDEVSGGLTGECIPKGAGATPDGDACTSSSDCVSGSICLDVGIGKTCLPLCDAQAAASAPGSCDAGSWCTGLVSGGEPLAYGACAPGCSPFVDHAESGCPDGAWCAPGSQDLTASQCVATTGTVAEGGRCGEDLDASGAIDDDERCGLGLFCIGFAGGPRCAVPCDPAADTDGAGHCTNASDHETCSCIGLTSGGVPLAVGIVSEGCVYDHAGPRTECDSWGTCVAAELFGGGMDRCAMNVPALEYGASCAAAGLENYDLCAPFGLCIDLGDGALACRYMCSAAAGELGSTSHPECPADHRCAELTENAAYGLCLPPN
ncbi:MAG: hypothetical protein EP329_11495 [Deltaproteobacteria bacterium]|nr:MAG: hypothetical protein EP329_11495 [Deltaproteobacteria bacterium]